MGVLEQCRSWNESGDFDKSREALEAIPAEDRSAEMDLELARAYIAFAEVEGKTLYQRALDLLEPREEALEQNYDWNEQLAEAYYYLDEEGIALQYFERALRLRPETEEVADHVADYIEDCRNCLACPRFEKPFRERTAEAWAAFSDIEEELRQALGKEVEQTRVEELLEKCHAALKLAFQEIGFQLGFGKEKYELALDADAKNSKLFPLVYFQRHAPKSVLEHWDVRVGRRPMAEMSFCCQDVEIRVDEVQFWMQEIGEQQIELELYCEKLCPLLREDSNAAEWMLYQLAAQVLGDIAVIAFLESFQVLEEPKSGGRCLSELPAVLETRGFRKWEDAGDFLSHSAVSYEPSPVEDQEADWRLDVYAGETCSPCLINAYLHGESAILDQYHRDGIAAGFLLYPLSSFSGEGSEKKAQIFREELQKAIEEQAGSDAVTFTGWATGLYYAYLDFIAWDLEPILNAAFAFCREQDMRGAEFHSFRRDAASIVLQSAEEVAPKVYEETGSLLSTEDIQTLESLEDGFGGYYWKMFHWIEAFVETGVREGRFTEKQARQDLQLALWYARACNNIDEYKYYYRAAMWLKDSKDNAGGCGTWYYRYSVALLHSGRCEEALQYAEQGVREEPDYPWNYLLLGKLRAAFGDKTGAQRAVSQGLRLVPGDYEFQTLKREIEENASLEKMLYHWINPAADRALQEGKDEDAESKQRSIACVRIDEAGLKNFYQLFCPEQRSYTKNAPYCEFLYPVSGREVKLSFVMNEAGISKLDTAWLVRLKEKLDGGIRVCQKPETGPEGKLESVWIEQTGNLRFVYRQPGHQKYFVVEETEDGTVLID